VLHKVKHPGAFDPALGVTGGPGSSGKAAPPGVLSPTMTTK
jgi:hypothetical protein